ncbi:MAG: hypothetical protein ABII23_07320 [bacterium]
MKRAIILILFVSFTALGCGDSNWFKSFHKAGSSSDVESLSADADVALLNKDFGAALNFYEQILDKDPNNSEALYGASAAWLGAAGFDVASIISNIMTNQDKVGSPVLPQMLAISQGVSKHSTGDFLPSDMDWDALQTATAQAIIYLRQIAAGNTDGVIPANNSNVRVNLIVCLVLNSIIRLVDLDGDGDVDNDPQDPVTIASNYTISYDDDKFDAIKQAKALVILNDFYNVIIDEIVLHFDALLAAYQVDTGDAIGELKTDINTTFKAEVAEAIAHIEGLTF